MKYFLDTEFFEQGHQHPIQLISLGIVAEDGREFYMENSDVRLQTLSPWLQTNVVPHLTGPKLPHKELGPAVLRFLGNDTKPQFWAYFADYDWVVFCQLYGAMISLPETFPMFCRDLKQEMWRLGVSKPALSGLGPNHNALADARWNKALFDYLLTKGLVLP